MVKENVVHLLHDSSFTKYEPKIITLIDYVQNPNCLQKCKLADLREMLRHYKKTVCFLLPPQRYSADAVRLLKDRFKQLYDFALVGAKPVLMQRLVRFFAMSRSAILVQRILRGHFIRTMIALRGPALKNRGICINETDFYTLDPIADIGVDHFFSYTDDKNFTYGFEIESLLKSIKHQSHKLMNPYTRESMNLIMPNINKIHRIWKMYEKKENKIVSMTTQGTEGTNANANADVLEDGSIVTTVIMLRDIREKTVPERARQLFTEIDDLGNYTNVNWFLNLDATLCLRLFHFLYDIWNRRAGLTADIKIKICPLWDPFALTSVRYMQWDIMSFEDKQKLCLSVMEEIVFTGINREYKTLGAFHVLSALTIVSRDARESMMWLYESLA